MTPPDVARVASGLSKAQREALAEACGDEDLFITRWKHGRSVRALHRAGLTNAPPPGGPRDGLIAVLTPLGIAVRNHINSEAGR